MAAPNYAFAKKQRELAKKKKNDEKLRKKTGKPEQGEAGSAGEMPKAR
jgi:hypothetical protein